MKINGNGIILSSQRLQENLLIIKIFSEEHGIYKGAVRASAGSKSALNYQLANLVSFNWQARLPEHLGTLKCESIKAYQQFILSDKLKLYAFNSIVEQILFTFHEHEAHQEFYEEFYDYLEINRTSKFSWLLYNKLEIALLKAAGFELELGQCAVTSSTENLTYVSPKTGRAVSTEASKGYEAPLIALPQYLSNNVEPFDELEVLQGFKLTEYFLQRYIWSEKNFSDIAARNMLKGLLYR